jgi:hypothetical protein
MKPMRWLAAILICATATAVNTPQGTVPKAAADQYRASAAGDGITIGATLLNAKEVRQAFRPRSMIAARLWRWRCIQKKTDCSKFL